MPIIVVYSILNRRKYSKDYQTHTQSPCTNFVQQDFVLIDCFSDVFAKVDKLLDRAFLQKSFQMTYSIYVFFFRSK